MLSRIRLLPVCLLVLTAAVACASPGEAVPEEARVLRMMVFPAPDGGLDPASEEGLKRLSVLAGTPLQYVGRGGGGHVLVTEEAVGAEEIRVIFRRLLDHPAVAHAEEDRRVTHQGNR